MRIAHSNFVPPRFSGKNAGNDNGSDTDESCDEMMTHMETLPLNANRLPFISMSTSLLHHPDVFEKIQAENKPKARKKLLAFVSQLADRSRKYEAQPLNTDTRSRIKGLWKKAKHKNPQGYKTGLYNIALSSDEFVTAQQKVAKPLSSKEEQDLYLRPSVIEELNKEAAETISGKSSRDKHPFIASTSTPGESSAGSTSQSTMPLPPTLTVEKVKQFQELSDLLKKNIIGQDRALEMLLKVIKGACVLNMPHFKKRGEKQQPRMVVLLAGPSGVGKTETVKLLKQFGNRDIVHLEGGHYSDQTHTNKITGTGPGYSGNKDKTVVDDIIDACELAKKEGRQPPIILIDELDKTAKEFFTIWNAALDGRMERRAYQDRDENGNKVEIPVRKVDFTNIDIFCTSNFAQHDITKFLQNKQEINRNDTKDIVELIKKVAYKEKNVQPDFWGRFTNIIPYENLSMDAVRKITNHILESHRKDYSQEGLAFEVSPSVVEKITPEGYSPEEGCRALQEVIQTLIGEASMEPLLEFKILQEQTHTVPPKKKLFITLDSESNIQGQLLDAEG